MNNFNWKKSPACQSEFIKNSFTRKIELGVDMLNDVIDKWHEEIKKVC